MPRKRSPPSVPLRTSVHVTRLTRLTRLPHLLAGVVALAVSCVPSGVRNGSHGVETLVVDRVRTPIHWPDRDSVELPPIPRGALASDSAVRLALLRSPALRASLASVGIAAADLWQASTLPNPVIGAQYGAPAAGGTAITSVGLGFSIVTALQVPLRRRIATAELAGAEQRVADAVLGLMNDVRRAYVGVQHAQQVLELRQNMATAASASAGAAKALRVAGNVSTLLLAGEEAMAAQAAADLPDADRDLDVARAALSRLLGAGIADTAWTVPLLLREPDTTAWRLAPLDSLALARRLDVAAARDAARAAAAALGLSERFSLLADGTIGAFVERDPDGRFAGPTVSVPLPLFEQGGAAIARARAVLRERVARHDVLVGDVHADIRVRLAQVRATRQRAQQLRRVVLPLRRRVIEEAQRHLNVNDISVFVLLQAKQAEFDTGRLYLDALRDYWNARGDLERSAGGSLPEPATP